MRAVAKEANERAKLMIAVARILRVFELFQIDLNVENTR